jgi:5-methylcytosine-specific restriction endonuclease McrA
VKRSAPLKRSGSLKRTPFKRTPSVGRKPSTRTKIPAKVRAAVEQRAGMRCEIRANSQGKHACEGVGYHCHHVVMRSSGGQHTEENLLLTCDTCHRYVHSKRTLAYERGWIKRAG